MKHDIISAARINMYGERGHPCLTPLWKLKDSESNPLFIFMNLFYFDFLEVAMVINYCILYVKHYIYLAKLKEEDEKANLI